MHLMVTRNEHRHQGFSLHFCDNDESTLLCLINGNKSNVDCPIFINEIDPFVVFGLSLPLVISRIIEQGPQILLSSKEIGHKIFEHGMKAAWGKVKIKNNSYLTNLETFYRHEEGKKCGRCELSVSQDAKGNLGLNVTVMNQCVTFHNSAFIGSTETKRICIDNIKNYMLIDLPV